jgi:hypothetical protein
MKPSAIAAEAERPWRIKLPDGAARQPLSSIGLPVDIRSVSSDIIHEQDNYRHR